MITLHIDNIFKNKINTQEWELYGYHVRTDFVVSSSLIGYPWSRLASF